jgi:S-adenosylmethionine decarboxylase
MLADLYGCDAQFLADPDKITDCLMRAAKAAGATVLNAHFHHFGEQQGVTGVLLLMESHMSIHTWPEHGYAAIDLFMCGQAQVEAALSAIQQEIGSTREAVQLISRGVF